MKFDHDDLEVLVLLVSSIPFGSYTISDSSSTEFSEPGGQENDGVISFSTKCSKVSYFLHNARLWVAVLVQICGRRKFYFYYFIMPEEGIKL